MKKKKTKKTDSWVARSDGWKNTLTGLGVYAKDRRLTATPDVAINLTENQLSDLYDGDALAKKIVQKPVKAMLRDGWVTKDVDDKQLESLQEQHKRLKTKSVLREALYWEALYGSSLLLFGTDDGQEDLTRPLNVETVKEVRYLKDIPGPQFTILSWGSKHSTVPIGDPEIFQISPADGSQAPYAVHASRAHFFKGDSISSTKRAERRGKGLSSLVPVYSVLRDFAASYDGAFSLATDFSQVVYKIGALREAIAQDRSDVIKERLRLMDMTRSIIGGVFMDADGNESFERNSTNVTGLPDLLQCFDLLLSAVTDIPVTVLFGTSAKGLSATGEGDDKNWHYRLAEDQAEKAVPALEALTSMLLPGASGWSIAFPPFEKLSDKDLAATHYTQAQADQINISNGIYTPEEARTSRFGGESYSTETTLRDDVTEDLETQLEEMLATDPDDRGLDLESSEDDEEEGEDNDQDSEDNS